MKLGVSVKNRVYESGIINSILFNEFVCKLGSLLHEWPTSAIKSPIYTQTS
jgi:hypothetical protein